MNVYVVMEWHEYDGGTLLGAKDDIHKAQALASQHHDGKGGLKWEAGMGEPVDPIPGWKRSWSAEVPKDSPMNATRTYDIHEIWTT